MIKRLHHVGVLTGDIEAESVNYQRLLGASPPRIRHIAREGFSLRTAMVEAGSGSFVQLIQPEVGPGVAELEQRGDGALYEIAFEVDDIEAVASRFRAIGVTPCDLAGTPIDESYLVAASGNRYFYLPPAQTGGSHMEFIQVMAKTEEGRP